MRLTKIGLLALKGSSDLRKRIVELEGNSLETVNRWIRENDSNLTKVAILDAIKEETGLSTELLVQKEAEPATK